jgi:hypothetical protein
MISFQLREVLTTERENRIEIIGLITLLIHIIMQLYLLKQNFWSDESFMGSIFSQSPFFKNKNLQKLQDAIVSPIPAFKSGTNQLTDDKKEELLKMPCLLV